ncbi:RNA 2'-phosphotransferase [Paracidovorax oryzae]|uniref:RNA 2'-phosphotransferase n=1 Tax=Paracidovorax oryzae TaxID=862720 RepID=UPI00068ED6D7|nr:RNA 2'-phosphotransferase [Paracidovorax oryzae]
MDSETENTSKLLAFILRHKPESIGLQLDPEGWARISCLVEQGRAAGHLLNLGCVMQAIHAGTKRRYEVSEDGLFIRAIQGHSSLQVQRQLQAAHPPEWLFHGTATRFLPSIQEQGLVPSGRHHVHLSSDQATAIEVGRRHGEPVVLRIAAQRLHAGGHMFHQVENGVWLTSSVPPGFLSLAHEGFRSACRESGA